jgi:hypothetical protein
MFDHRRISGRRLAKHDVSSFKNKTFQEKYPGPFRGSATRQPAITSASQYPIMALCLPGIGMIVKLLDLSPRPQIVWPIFRMQQRYFPRI